MKYIKRYDMVSVSDYPTDDRCMIGVVAHGGYVKYSDIKSDRALLKEAVKIIEKLKTELATDMELFELPDSSNIAKDLVHITDFLVRTKEVLK